MHSPITHHCEVVDDEPHGRSSAVSPRIRNPCSARSFEWTGSPSRIPAAFCPLTTAEFERDFARHTKVSTDTIV
ncbi:hypothetical protein QS468_39840 [Bacillus subtilis]|nr:hypothetical protein [Pseudomonas sp. A29(2023)]MDL5598916.1 hypothetical protein [Bacillus subtilis]